MKISEDKLERGEFLKDLFNIFDKFGNQNGRGLTMVINGKYGSGKSTLLDFIEEENEKDKKYNILKYNSWENNIFDNPLIPILYTISKVETKSQRIKDGAKNILKKLPKMLFATLANAHSIDLQEICTNENIFEEYDSYNKALLSFKKILSDFCEVKKTIFLVDELDRCLPEYQIKVLENLYHLLDIPNLIVVIALDKDQLECAIKSKFGEQQNTYGYLAKFIQYEIDLPEGDAYRYITQLMTYTVGREHGYEVKNLIADMFRCNELSIRESQLILNEVNIICNEVDNRGKPTVWLYWYPIMLTLLIMIKKIEPTIFKKYYSQNKKSPNNYFREMKLLKDTSYMRFLNDIENTSVKNILDVLLSNGYGQCFMLHFINTIYPVKEINLESLAEYIGRSVEDVKAILSGYGERMSYYPEGVNEILEKLRILR